MNLPPNASRRSFLSRGGLAVLTAATLNPWPMTGQTPSPKPRRFTLDLLPGAIGVNAGQIELMELAARHGFESFEPNASYLARLDEDGLERLQAELAGRKLRWGATGLPVNFRGDEATFQSGMKELPGAATALRRAGATRVGTWLSSSSAQLTYVQNFSQHERRLRAVAEVLGDHGLRFGLEYVGTYAGWTGRKFPFIHTLAETRELIAAIDRPAMGLVLDSWHWWCAEDSLEDLLQLSPRDIVAVDLNDAPVGREKRAQKDNERELPGATGRIDAKAFLGTLQTIGYDGPVRAEPFNRGLNAKDNDAACADTIAALRRCL